MKSHAGVAAQMFGALANKKINIDMISTSEIKISVVVAKDKAEEAVIALHDEFELDKQEQGVLKMDRTVDYIVVGAGSSGCVMANRLSEDGKKSVLILEAGGKDTNFFIHMPAGYSQIVPSKSAYNYGFETEPEETTKN